MTKLRIEAKPAFMVSGKKVWISGQDNEQFGAFWAQAHENGLVGKLKSASSEPSQNVTGSRIMGVSRVEKNPGKRAFYFYIASECDGAEGCESLEIPACEWAIFTGSGTETLPALIEAEMEAFMNWLPDSIYKHALAPELEVYPEVRNSKVEFWLPIERK